MKPIILSPNQPAQFYRGGAAIAAFRHGDGAPRPTSAFGPEDWIASTVSIFGGTSGLSVLPDGQLLRGAIIADPLGFLGPQHYAAFGADPALLVKMLDAGERLPVHVHPDQAFAKQHLNCRYGKTEAWIVVGTTGPDPAVFVGFHDTVDAAAIATWVDEQMNFQHASLCMHRVQKLDTGAFASAVSGVVLAYGMGIGRDATRNDASQALVVAATGDLGPGVVTGFRRLLPDQHVMACTVHGANLIQLAACLTSSPGLKRMVKSLLKAQAKIRKSPTLREALRAARIVGPPAFKKTSPGPVR